MLKVVIDTNVFISSVLTKGGKPSVVIKIWKRTRKYQLFYTEEIIRVMTELNVDVSLVKDWDKTIRKNAILVVPTRKIEAIKEDPPDDKFIECAIESHADYIITGDKHLRRLKEYEGIKIINAAEFLEILKTYKEPVRNESN